MKEELKKEFEEKFDTLYEAGGFHDDYEDVTKELWTWFESQIDRIRGDREQQLIDVEDLLTTFCADVYIYAHNKKEVFGENREYFVTLEELDRVFTAFIGNLKSKSGGICK